MYYCRYPHDEVNHLSCNETHIYGGIVSLIPSLLDLLKVASSSLAKARPQTPALTDLNGSAQQTGAGNTGNMSATLSTRRSTNQSAKVAKEKDEWKPAWKPPGHNKTY